MIHALSQNVTGGGKRGGLLLTLLLLLAAPVQRAQADNNNTLTLEASKIMPDSVSTDSVNGPEHVYVLHNAQSPNIYWKADLTPANTQKDLGTFAFCQVKGKDNAYYIYDCSAGQWLTYEVQDSYGETIKGKGTPSYVKLDSIKNVKAYFIITSASTGYLIELVNNAGERPGTRWYLNYFGGYDDKTKENTLGIYWHGWDSNSNGYHDAGSVWILATPPSSDTILIASTKPSDAAAADKRLENVFVMHNGYGAGVGLEVKPTTEEDEHGHFVFYKGSGENEYYIYDYSKGKWLTYGKRDSYNTSGATMYGEYNFVQLSDTRANSFYITHVTCNKGNVRGYQIQPYNTKGEPENVYLNYYWGAQKNQNNTIGFYTHPGTIDLGSLWTLEATDPHKRTIDEEGTNSQFAYLGDVDVSLKRTLKAGSWNTFCLPFSVSASSVASVLGQDCKLREFTSADAGSKTLSFTEATQIEAGKPYLVKPDAGVTNPTFPCRIIQEGEAQKVEHEGYGMVGTYGRAVLTIDGTNLFLAADNVFKKPKDAQNKHNVLKGMRAYFTVLSGTNEAQVHAIVEGELTAIDAVADDADVQPSPVYDLQGRYMGNSLSGLGRGVYVQNGHKFVVK